MLCPTGTLILQVYTLKYESAQLSTRLHIPFGMTTKSSTIAFKVVYIKILEGLKG